MLLCLASCLILFLTACNDNSDATSEAPLQVFAAASLASVMPEIVDAYQQHHKKQFNNDNMPVELTLAASSVLARQIERGAAADIFISANVEWAHYLGSKHMLRGDSVSTLFGNRLVLIISANRQNNITVAGLTSPSVHAIALGDWTHVPAGIYARETLQNLGIWATIEHKCLPAMDVRAALAYVERGDADCGIVYQSDAAISKKVRVAGILPEEMQPDIHYPAVIIQRSVHLRADNFFRFLHSADARRIFAAHGFQNKSR